MQGMYGRGNVDRGYFWRPQMRYCTSRRAQSNLAISAESACLPTTVAVARHRHTYWRRVWSSAVCCSVLIETRERSSLRTGTGGLLMEPSAQLNEYLAESDGRSVS